MNYGEIARWSVVASSLAFAIVLIWGMRRFAIPAIAAANEAKNLELAHAEARLTEIRLQVERLRGSSADAESDAAAIRARGEEQARRESAAALEEARSGGERVLRNAHGELERARAAASESLRNEFLEKALARARDEAAKRVTPGVNSELVDRFVNTLGHGGLN